MTNEVANPKDEKYAVSYQSNGQNVDLSPSVVNQFVTKGNAKITGEEAVNFIKLCQYAQLNPFLNEAYLVKFNGSPAQMITSKEAFMKRAENNPAFNGLKAGIIVDKDGEMVKRDGALRTKKEEIIGAWCEVFRTDRENSTYVEISYDEFSKTQATWKQQPANMIRKVAVVNALREAFPNSLGAMYTEDDKSPQDVMRQAEKADEDEKTSTLLDEFKTKQPPKEEVVEAEVIEGNKTTNEFDDILAEAEQMERKEAEKVEVAEDDEQGQLFKGRTFDPNE